MFWIRLQCNVQLLQRDIVLLARIIIRRQLGMNIGAVTRFRRLLGRRQLFQLRLRRRVGRGRP